MKKFSAGFMVLLILLDSPLRGAAQTASGFLAKREPKGLFAEVSGRRDTDAFARVGGERLERVVSVVRGDAETASTEVRTLLSTGDADPAPQAGPTSTQGPTRRRKHLVRNLVIIFALGAALLIALAAADRR